MQVAQAVPATFTLGSGRSSASIQRCVNVQLLLLASRWTGTRCLPTSCLQKHDEESVAMKPRQTRC